MKENIKYMYSKPHNNAAAWQNALVMWRTWEQQILECSSGDKVPIYSLNKDSSERIKLKANAYC
jgi:hypothetical protein